MANDLISKSALINRFKQLKGSDNLANMFVVDVINEIKKQPTTYDVDKVVEELKEWSFEAEIVIPGSDGYDDTANREIICTGNAIDIVRKGGVE